MRVHLAPAVCTCPARRWPAPLKQREILQPVRLPRYLCVSCESPLLNLLLTYVTYGVNHHVMLASFRQLPAGLLRHQILGIPIGPVRIALAGSLLVLAVGGLRTP